MRRRSINQLPPDIRFTGTHFSDPVKEWLSGFNIRKRATKDATRLSNEVLNYRNDLFPVRSIPVLDKPGRVTLNRDFFKVQFKNGRINRDLTDYFSEERYSRSTVSYGSGHDLGEFFEMVFHALLVDGIDAYAVEWKRIKVGGRYYILPFGFHWINPATIQINKFNEDVYLVQKFNPISKFINSYYEYRNHSFSKDESLIFKYPESTSPVSASLKFLKKLTQGIDFGLNLGRANTENENYSLELEKTRYRSLNTYIRQENMTRVKVRRIFNQPIGGFGVSITSYYEVYAYAEYKKHLNLIREYLISEFNEQIIKKIKEKNGFATQLTLNYQGFAKNNLIEDSFLKYSEHEITVDEFLAKVEDSYNTNTF